MCGLVTVITKGTYGFKGEQRDMFSLLLMVDVLRGDDSTGAFTISNLGNVDLAKEASSSLDFIRRPEYKELAGKAFQNGWAMVGHNRKATRGNIVDENAHPFIVDDKIVLVHNGSLNGDHKHHAETEVDSEAIAHVLAAHDDPEIALRKINGAFALIWYEVDHKRLNVVRNSQRPLWMMETDNEYVIASEEAFLKLVQYKFGMETKEQPYQLKEECLLRFTLGDDKRTTLEVRDIDVSYYKHNKTTPAVVVHPFPFPGSVGSANDEEDDHSIEAYFRRQCGLVNGYSQTPSRSDTTGAFFDTEDGQWKRRTGTGIVVPYNTRHIPVSTEFSTLDKAVVNRFIETIKIDGNVAINKFKMNADLTTAYPKGTKVKVIVHDLTEADDTPRTNNYLLIGRLLNTPSVYAVFPMLNKQWSEVSRAVDSSVFEVEVNTFSWHRTESQDVKGKSFEDFDGIICLHGKNAEPIYVPPANEDQLQ